MSEKKALPGIGDKIRSVRRGCRWGGVFDGIGTVTELRYCNDFHRHEIKITAITGITQTFSEEEWEAGDIVLICSKIPVGLRRWNGKAWEPLALPSGSDGGDLCTVRCDETGRVLVAFDKARLARALFDDGMRAEAQTIADPGDGALATILDIMWSKTKPDERKFYEDFAERLCAAMEKMS